MRDQIIKLLKDYNGYDFCGEKACSGQNKADELVREVFSLVYEKLLYARIDELEHTVVDGGLWHEDYRRDFPQKISHQDRLKELRSQLTAKSTNNGKRGSEPESKTVVNRFEVIDHTKTGSGRELVKWEEFDFEVKSELQDGGRTLKVFLRDRAEN